MRRVNKLSCQIGHLIQETIIISIHVNAAGNGRKWHNATGWCCYTYYGHSLSDELATCLYKAARHHLPGHKLRTDTADGDPDLESAFYILKYTYAACVLTENGFMDSPLSLAFLESDEGKKAIISLHVDGIIDFIQQRANEPL